MHYALDFRTFLYSHYFYTGLRIASGILFAIMLVINLVDISTTMTVFLGALCTSLMDLPSPLRHKFNEMLGGLILCTFVILVISLSAPFILLTAIFIVLICFFSSLMLVYGKKTMPIQFAALLVMTMTMADEFGAMDALIHTASFLGGGLFYLTYAMAISFLLKRRFKQQILSESLFELAFYIRTKSGFYDLKSDLKQQFNALVRQQILLADKQQAARDLILRDIDPKLDGRLIQVHLAMLDLYEQILSTHADYALLRNHFGDTEVMTYLRDLTLKTAVDIEGIAYAITRNRVAFSKVNFNAELRAIEYELVQYHQNDWGKFISPHAMSVLNATFHKMRDMIGLIHQLHLATACPIDTPSTFSKDNVTPFLTQQRYKLDFLRAHLHWQSPFFRFSVRVALAVMCGLWLGAILPYTAYPHWIVLTIVIILKPNFSSTKKRLYDRLTGTIIGCIIAAIALQFISDHIGLIALLFLASIAAPAFTTIKYRYTAIAASIQILLLMHLLTPGSGLQFMVGERLIDTLIGITLAALFGYVLPSWEYHGIAQLVHNVLTSNQRYIQASNTLFAEETNDDFFYRICRKDFMNSLAALIDAQIRMSDEPIKKQRANKELNAFVIQNYLVAAHVAALRIILKRYHHTMPRFEVTRLMTQTFQKADQQLRAAQWLMAQHSQDQILPNHSTQEETSPHAPDFVLESEMTETNQWSGWHTLYSRTDLLAHDLVEIVKQTEAISSLLSYQSTDAQALKQQRACGIKK